MIGWLQGANYPGMPFSQGMTVPLEMKLQPDSDLSAPYRLCFFPVHELDELHTSELHRDSLDIVEANALLGDAASGELLDLNLDLETSHPFTLRVGDTPLTWDPESNQISFAGKSAGLPAGTQILVLRLLVDRSVTEVFVNEGWAAFSTATIFPASGRSLLLEGELEKVSIQIFTLKSIWD